MSFEPEAKLDPAHWAHSFFFAYFYVERYCRHFCNPSAVGEGVESQRKSCRKVSTPWKRGIANSHGRLVRELSLQVPGICPNSDAAVGKLLQSWAGSDAVLKRRRRISSPLTTEMTRWIRRPSNQTLHRIDETPLISGGWWGGVKRAFSLLCAWNWVATPPVSLSEKFPFYSFHFTVRYLSLNLRDVGAVLVAVRLPAFWINARFGI